MRFAENSRFFLFGFSIFKEGILMILFYFKDILWYNITRFFKGNEEKSVAQKWRCVIWIRKK